MCGRYTLFADQADLEERFDARFVGSFAPRYNVAPGQRAPVVTDDEPETIRRFEWGFAPSWADDGSDRLINARAETVAAKPSFRAAYERRGRPRGSDGTDGDGPSAGRCLVLADGFYEWVETDGGKRPYRVAFEDDRPFAMAGLWERRKPEPTQTGLDAFGGGVSADDDRSGVSEAFTVLTTEPNDLVADLHHRMAAILEPGAEDRWLTDADPQSVLEPYPTDDMRAYPVSRRVGDPSNDHASLVEPV